MKEIFRMEYHPINSTPRRIRFLLQGDTDHIERVIERRANSGWKRIDSEVIEYFEYSDT